jgi:hypothetical protein
MPLRCTPLQRLRDALPVKLSAVPSLAAGDRARRLRYASAAEYRADMDVLGLAPGDDEMAHEERYCYMVPTAPLASDGASPPATHEHCQVGRAAGARM